MADVNRGNRPLSPFMIGPYYRPQWTSMTSIFTRITGNGLILAAVLVVWWFLAAAAGPDAYRIADDVITSWLGDLVMFLSLAALWYHTLAGLRHLIWDTGRLLEVETAERLGQGMVVLTLVLTIVTALII